MLGWFSLFWGALGIGVGVGIAGGQMRLGRRFGVECKSWWTIGVIVAIPLLFYLLAWKLGWERELLIRSLWVAVLIQIASFDLESRFIADGVLLPAMLVALLLSPLTPGLGWPSALGAGIIAGAAALGIALIGRWIFRTEALGLGDVKLAGFIGLILGMKYTWIALLSGVILAGVFAAALVLLRLKGLRDTIAYGPYLAAGALLGLFLSV